MTNASQLIKQSGIEFGTSGARGLVEQFTPQACYAFTVAFIKALEGEFSFQRVAIAIDNRPSSYAMAKSISAMVKHLGFEAEFFGVLPTPALAFYALQNRMPCIMVTGSHIPFDRNGLKFYRPDGEISKADEAKIISCNESVTVPNSEDELDILHSATNLYIERYTQHFPNKPFSGKRLGIYEHSSAGRDIYKKIFESLGAEVISLGRSDQFVPIDTEAVSDEDKSKALNWSKELNLDAIFSTDGDGDRPLIAEEFGNWLRGDILGLATAKYLKAKLLATPVSCNTAIELSDAFEKVVRTKIGSPYVIEAFGEQDENLKPYAGFEANGGFLLGTDCNYGGGVFHALPTRDAVLPALVLFNEAWSNQSGISELIAELPRRFTASDRIKEFPREISLSLIDKFANSEDMRGKLQEELSIEGTLESSSEIDGYRMVFTNNEIVHFRPSGNAPELRCYAEADTQERAENLVELALKTLKALSIA
ncbi:phosphomannomutase [Pseudoalteromonas luteoviolacea]|uniref:phosphomannomutase n=1 Tax=Pseudoalteromonas luteoviolacea TaxID=43657 RepID=UPI001B3590B3|nr:phosphomannomutase [Pseudoalteromonas luteoviolacea]MBQ4812058.1 phosphomannomutase [Pseudoalteromonas luteoviolacea]